MIKHSVKLVACIGFLGGAVLANDAKALTKVECEQLPGNMFLAAIERGDCDINIQTAAGPQDEPIIEDNHDHNRDGRNGGRTGGEKTGGGGSSGGDGRNAAGAKP
jgi:uncharacterized membrane protein YgcG